MNNQTQNALVLWLPTEDETLSLEQEVLHTEEFIESRRSQVEAVMAHYNEAAKDVIDLENKIELELALYGFNQTPEYDAFDEDDGGDEDDDPIPFDEVDSEGSREARLSSGVTRKHEAECKRVYKKIMRLCHPDKTKNKDLNALGLEARDCYELFKLNALTLILIKATEIHTNSGQNVGNALVSRYLGLKYKLETLKAELEEVNEEYNSIAVVYHSNPEAAKLAFRDIRIEDHLTPLLDRLSVIGQFSSELRALINSVAPNYQTPLERKSQTFDDFLYTLRKRYE